MKNRRRQDSVLWVTDADNTLWDTDSVYRTAQLKLLADVERETGIEIGVQDRLSAVRRIDQMLAKSHEKGLRYPPQMLVSALHDLLVGIEEESAVKRALGGTHRLAFAVDEMVDQHLTDLKALPRLRPGVFEGLKALAAIDAHVVVATEGSEGLARQRLASHGIEKLVLSLVAGTKAQKSFEDISSRFPSPRRYMIGDQTDRDIVPALAAGFSCFYFPGGFQPFWADAHAPCPIVTDYSVAVSMVSPDDRPQTPGQKTAHAERKIKT